MEYLTLVVLLSAHHLAWSAKLRIYKGSFEVFTEVDLDSPSLGNYTDINKPFVFGAFGYNFDPDNGRAVSTLMGAFIDLETVNVVLVNWAKEASDRGLGVLGYPFALAKSKKVGNELGEAILKLVRNNVINDDIHLFGHSLGAHMLGYAGRRARELGFIIPMQEKVAELMIELKNRGTKATGTKEKLIEALDAARAGFQSEILIKLVDTTSAANVIAVHCDPGGYGLNKSLGHIDFWFNYNEFRGGSKMQPGCSDESTSIQDAATSGNICNHDRCWRYYSVSLTNETLFEAGKASNYTEFANQNGRFAVTNFMGPAVDKEKRGNFYLNTGPTEPWGKGKEGLMP